MLVDRLLFTRDATEMVVDSTRDEMKQYEEGILDVVHVIEAFRHAVHTAPRDRRRSPYPPPEEHESHRYTPSAPSATDGSSGPSGPQPTNPIPTASTQPEDTTSAPPAADESSGPSGPRLPISSPQNPIPTASTLPVEIIDLSDL